MDNILSLPVETTQNADEWVQLHHYRMKEAITRATNQMNMKAGQRKKRHDRKAKSHNLPVGMTVLLRNRVLGRNKIQDVWNSTKYTVLGQIADDSSALLVSRSTDGKTKSVNRVDVLPWKFGSSSEDQDSLTEENQHSASSSSSDEMEGYEIHGQLADPPIVPPASVRRTRRSDRRTAGQHSNPHHLPRSALQESVIADAIIKLGYDQVKVLNKPWNLLQKVNVN